MVTKAGLTVYQSYVIARVSYWYKNTFGTDKFVQFRPVFGLQRFKLHIHLVDWTVKSVWFRQVFGLLRVLFRQVFGLLRVLFRQVFGLLRIGFRQASL